MTASKARAKSDLAKSIRLSLEPIFKMIECATNESKYEVYIKKENWPKEAEAILSSPPFSYVVEGHWDGKSYDESLNGYYIRW